MHSSPAGVIALANLGARLIPLAERGKAPLVKQWTNAASPDPQILDHWAELYPNCNWGLATGAGSGVFVIDLDAKSGGLESWERLLDGREVVTWECVTGGGGRHLYFKYPMGGEVRNSASRVSRGVDVRGEGGQVVIPPSVHANGNEYAWVAGREPWSLKIATAPAWLAKMVVMMPGSDIDQMLPGLGESPVKGERNDAIYHQGLILARRGADREFTYSAMRTWLDREGHTDIEDAEIRATVDSAFAKYEAEAQQRGQMIDPYERTDADNAKRFVESYSDRVMYVHGLGWFAWNGSYWEPDPGDAVVTTYSILLMRKMREEALQAAEDKTLRKAAMAQVQWSMTSQNVGRLRAMLDLASRESTIRKGIADLDSTKVKWLVNFTNGTLDLSTGELGPHKKEHLITRCVPYAYDPEAQCPTWMATIKLAFSDNPDLVSYFQRALGYSMSAATDEQCIFICWGEQGNNGKSTLLEAFQKALGTGYARTSDVKVITAREVDNRVASSLAGLVGARFVGMSEAEEHQKLSEALLKQLTGGDTLEARLLYRDPFTFEPVFKVWLRTNERPQIRGADDAIWRRIRLIPFVNSIPKDKRRRRSDVDAELAAEAPGILAWAVRGFFDWKVNGMRDPSEVTKASEDYRSEMDTVGAFLEEMTERDPVGFVSRQDLYTVYVSWCRDEGQRFPFSAKGFGKRAGRHLGGDQEREKVDGRYVWRGIALSKQGKIKLLES